MSDSKWIKLKEYCKRTGDTPDAVHAKRRKGHFVDGTHTKIGPDGNIWCNPEAIDAWVEGDTEKEKQE